MIKLSFESEDPKELLKNLVTIVDQLKGDVEVHLPENEHATVPAPEPEPEKAEEKAEKPAKGHTRKNPAKKPTKDEVVPAPEEDEEAEDDGTEPPTKDDVVETLKELTTTKGLAASKALLKKYKAAKASDLKEKNYVGFIAAAKAEIAKPAEEEEGEEDVNG